MIILVLGGASSGKSRMAEEICLQLGKPLYYLATMQNDCDESRRKITSHRKLREGKNFETIEKPYCIKEIDFPVKGTLLLECLGNLLSNEMFREELDLCPNERILDEINNVVLKNNHTVIVSNDIFSSLSGLNNESIAYVRNLAYLNKKIAKKADVVIEAVCSLKNIIKGEDICRSLDIF